MNSLKNSTHIKKLREALPNGAYKTIAKKTGYSIMYVGKVLRGERPLTANNCKIIREAVKIIMKSKQELDDIINSLKQI